MKYVLPTLIAFFGLVTTSLSQSSPAEVVWSRDASCSTTNSPEVVAASPKCELVRLKNEVFYVMTFRGVSVAMSYSATKPFVQSTVQITNRSGMGLDFDPLESVILVFENEQAINLTNRKTYRLQAISLNEARSRYRPPSASPSVAIPGSSTTSIGTNTRIPDLLSTSTSGPTMTAGNPRTPTLAGSGPAVSRTSSQTTSSRIVFPRLEPALKKDTIPDQEKRAGFIFFKPLKVDRAYLVIEIKVGNVVFTFPGERNATKK
jgi:hypothetical protein